MTEASSRDWTLVTVTYNSAVQLASSWPKASIGEARWIVVDNASHDDSVEVARGLGAEVVRLPGNVGFGAANNVGLAKVSSQWVAFINPDVTVADSADLQRLASIARVNDGLVAPQLVNPDGTDQPNARGMPFLADKIANRLGRFPGARLNEYVRTGLLDPTYCAWVIGAAVAGETDLLRALDGWDERYFIYYEDHDLGLRCWRAGHSVVLDPAVRWAHEWQRETSRPRPRLKPWMYELRSGRRFFAHYPMYVWPGRRQGEGLSELSDKLWSAAVEPTPDVPRRSCWLPE